MESHFSQKLNFAVLGHAQKKHFGMRFFFISTGFPKGVPHPAIFQTEIKKARAKNTF